MTDITNDTKLAQDLKIDNDTCIVDKIVKVAKELQGKKLLNCSIEEFSGESLKYIRIKLMEDGEEEQSDNNWDEWDR